ncbi:hypothetical protein QU593_03955 [Rossellomorea marisflavi]|uniref:hypothetical protein n=1 Tax=Rossellomorea marisflavi TaxID=189381 RepID=UPI0025B17CCB|nr:hypothetical protein [Rossellomorea marisflavi]WJV19646.1 hypothetical protein QU593_03955 [Rossellomorea marisflavi]
MNNKLLIKKKERNKLLYSEITKQYPWLLTLLKENEKISLEDIEKLDRDQRVFIENVLQKLLLEASKEWKPDSDVFVKVLEGKERIRCSLCGTPNRYIYYIKNKINQQKLNVGGDCVKEFGEIGEWMHKNSTNIIKGQVKVQNLAKINKHIPGVESIISRWSKIIDAQPIYIPTDISKEYLELGLKATQLFEEILDGKGFKERSIELTHIIKISEDYIKDITDYVAKKKSNKFTATREICKFLKRTKKEYVLDMINKDKGEIKWRTAPRIGEKEFLFLLKEEYNNKILNEGYEITGVNLDKEGFNIINRDFDMINFFAKHSNFTLEFGWLLFDQNIDEDFDPLKLLNLCEVSDEPSLDTIISKIKKNIYRKHIRIIDYDVAKNSLYLGDAALNEYLKLNLVEFVSRYKILAFYEEEKLHKKLIEEFKQAPNKITKKEYYRDKEAASAAEREFSNNRLL